MKDTHQNTTSMSDEKLAHMITRLENRVVSNPNDLNGIIKLLLLLDCQAPNTSGEGPYSKCQRELQKQFDQTNLEPYDIIHNQLIKTIQDSTEFVNSHELKSTIQLCQIYEGTHPKIDDKPMQCGSYMSFFKQYNAIYSTCFTCYKVQILPNNIIDFIKLSFLLKHIELERNNARKCTIEIRPDIPHPYKGYIYCQTESEANRCLNSLRIQLAQYKMSNIRCGISHGCSEHGLEYPDFRYSNDGNHRRFVQSIEWKCQENNNFEIKENKGIEILDHNNKTLTLRDIYCFETWITYARLIGDKYSEQIDHIPVRRKSNRFIEMIRAQSEIRKSQLDFLLA